MKELKSTGEVLERIRTLRKKIPEIEARAAVARERMTDLQKRQLSGEKVEQEAVDAQVRSIMTAEGEIQAARQLEAELRQEVQKALEKDRARIQDEITGLYAKTRKALKGSVAKLRERLIALISEIEAEVGPCSNFEGVSTGGSARVRIPPEVIGDPSEFWAQVRRGARGPRVGSYYRIEQRREELQKVLVETNPPAMVAERLLDNLDRETTGAEPAGGQDLAAA
ncbi:MAG TPA: hypothetical protein ENK62_06625 [Chromatiales bacterium]|nr:hypothetical protein [Chromatiales bacterium]